MERSDFEDSRKRAQRARSRTHVYGLVQRDFKWVTGRFEWWPKVTENVYPYWNQTGGPATSCYHRTIYWLTMGWSWLEEIRLEEIPEDDPRDLLQNGGKDGRA